MVDYIDKQFESYLQEELKIKRSLHNYHDSRLHACLYFISPSGHSLKSLDLVTMKKLDSKVAYGVSVIHFVKKKKKTSLWYIPLLLGQNLNSQCVHFFETTTNKNTLICLNQFALGLRMFLDLFQSDPGKKKVLFSPKGLELLLSLLQVVRNFPMLPVCVHVVFFSLCVCVISLFRSVSSPGFVCEWSEGEKKQWNAVITSRTHT